MDIGFQSIYLMILIYIYIYIYSNIKQLYKQSYAISYNINHCSNDTKIILFKTCVSNIYLSSIWIPNRYCMAKLNIAYNNANLIVMNYRRRNSASLMFFNDYVSNLTVKLRKSYYSLYKRIQLSCNSLSVQLYEYNIVFPSPLFTIHLHFYIFRFSDCELCL